MFERPDGGERAVLVHCKYPQPNSSPDFSEFVELAISAGVEILDQVIVRRDSPEPKHLIGSGKLDELAQKVAEHEADVVLINYTVSPSQQRNLEKVLKVRVIDRTGLILDIFAQRARTHEGKLQVELAQLKYLSTRLIRGWTHLERQKGGIGMRGPGETQLETDRRLLRDRIKLLQARLEKVRQQRIQGRRARKKNDLYHVSIVGYTNAGKSTLFNSLTGEKIYSANKLFATLDTTIRALTLKTIGKVIVSDTVGFIRDLPHDLIESFKATLEETVDADLLVHVVDITDDYWRDKVRQVESVLSDIGALNVPILEVYNKIDMVEDLGPSLAKDCMEQTTGVFLSAKASEGMDLLKKTIAIKLTENLVVGKLSLSGSLGKLRAELYEMGAVDSESVEDSGEVLLQVSLPGVSWNKLCTKHPNLVKSLTRSSNTLDMQD